MDDFSRYSASQNKEALMYSQKRKTKMCSCGRGPIYTDSNSKFNAVVDNRQVCNECVVDSIYAKFQR